MYQEIQCAQRGQNCNPSKKRNRQIACNRQKDPHATEKQRSKSNKQSNHVTQVRKFIHSINNCCLMRAKNQLSCFIVWSLAIISSICWAAFFSDSFLVPPLALTEGSPSRTKVVVKVGLWSNPSVCVKIY